MMATRLKQFGLLLFSMLICGVAFFQMFERTTGGFPQNYLWMLAFVGALFLTSWGLCVAFPGSILSVYTNEEALLVESVSALYVVCGSVR